MAATVFGTLATLLAHLLDGSSRYATPVVAGVEGPDGNVRAQQGTNDGAAIVSPTGGDQPSKSDSALATLVDNTALPAAGAFTTTDYVAIPAGARRVTFVVKYTKAGPAATGQWKARALWKWSATVTDVCEPFVDPNSQTVAEPKVAIKSYCQDIAGPKYNAGTSSGLAHLTFEVPAGVVGAIVRLAEMGDAANPGAVSLFAATSEVL
jgi:hypothetical protein